MQYLKDDVKARILSSALAEFKENGYVDASVRSIAMKANITSGNIYRYFTNKEALFDALINPVYKKFMIYLSDIEKKLNEAPDNECSTIECINEIDNKMVELFKESSAELTILLAKSKGSKYENVKQDLITLIDRLLIKNLFQRIPENEIKNSQSKYITYVLASTLIEGVCIILRQHEDGDIIKALIDKLISIHFVGISDRIRIMEW